MNIMITHRAPYDPPVEFVERKGAGHPDTICDDLAERLARQLAVDYERHTGAVRHFNVDKAIFASGSVDIDFGGGVHTKPSKLVLVGKAAFDFDWKPNLEELAKCPVVEWPLHHIPEKVWLGRLVFSPVNPGHYVLFMVHQLLKYTNRNMNIICNKKHIITF